MKYRLAAATFVAILILVGCGGSSAESVPGDADVGRDLFENGVEGVTATCASCHTLDGSELDGTLAGPSLQGIAERAEGRVEGQSAVEYLRESIMDPSAYLVEGYNDNMEKGFKYVITDEQLDNLVAFLLTQ